VSHRRPRPIDVARGLSLDPPGRIGRGSGSAGQCAGADASPLASKAGHRMNLPIRPDITELEDSKIVDVWQRGLGRSDLVMLADGEGVLLTPKFIADAAYRSMLAGETFYTYKRGIPELRQALARYHRRHWGVEVADERVAVTSAGMNAMMLAAEIAIGAGD